MRLVVDNLSLEFSRRGSGPSMLWGHGLTSSMANEDKRALWSLAEPVNGAGFELIRYDARGHGRSEGRAVADDYTWANLANDAVALFDALASSPTDQWVIGGASMGAATMLHVATTRADLVRAMVLMIPPTAWETRANQRALYAGAAKFITEKGSAAYVAASHRLPPLPIFDAAGKGELMRSEPDIEEVFLPFVLTGAGNSDLPSPDAIRDLRMPTLILAWDTDPGHPVSTAERLAELLPNKTLHVARTFDEITTWPSLIGEFLRLL